MIMVHGSAASANLTVQESEPGQECEATGREIDGNFPWRLWLRIIDIGK
jgi:hypothetical protein